MHIDKVITRFVRAPHDQGELRRLARAVGNELPRERLEVLRALRGELAKAALSDGAKGQSDIDSYASGYLAGIVEIATEYENHVQQRMEQGDIARMMQRRQCREVVLALRDGARCAPELAAVTGWDGDDIIDVLHELHASGLVRPHGGNVVEERAQAYRLSVAGQELGAELGSGLSGDVMRGIRLAVELFEQVLTQASTTAADLDAVAGRVLGDPEVAAEAVNVWTTTAGDAGLLSARPTHTQPRQAGGIPYPLPVEGSVPVYRMGADEGRAPVDRTGAQRMFWLEKHAEREPPALLYADHRDEWSAPTGPQEGSHAANDNGGSGVMELDLFSGSHLDGSSHPNNRSR